MITIGVDAHKRVHVAVAVGEGDREIAHWCGANSVDGWRQLAQWAAALGTAVRWGIEGAWNYGHGLAECLLLHAVTVDEVNPRWTAAGRQRARRVDKNDRYDARAVALVVWREAAILTPLVADEETAVLDLLIVEREDAVAEATRLRNQLHQLLLHLDPEYTTHRPSLRSKAGLEALVAFATADPGPVQQHRAGAVRRLAERLGLAQRQAGDLAAQIQALAAPRFAPLTRICGISLLTAAALAGILGPGQRFTADAQLAAYAGVAPLEASSTGRVRYRLNRGGNRRFNAVFSRIAVTQARCSPQAQGYLSRRMAEGKTRREAIRALKRSIVRAI